jgi:peptidyl-prolyl cis-trans isomerase C
MRVRLSPLSAALLALVACERAPAPGRAEVDFRHTRQPGGSPIATWAGDQVTAEELSRRLGEMSPAQRERYQTLEARREYVEGLARYELLVQESLNRGLHHAPDVVESTKRALVTKLMRQVQEEAAASITPEEVTAYYASHKEDYVRPEEFRLTHLFLSAPRTDTSKVAAARQKAETLLAQARALPPKDAAAFGRLAREHSEEPRTRLLEGDLRYQSYESLARTWGPEVAEAARGLAVEGLGALRGPVQTDAGLHLLQLTGLQPARNSSLEEARDQVAGRLAEEKRAQAWATFLSTLEKRARLQVDAEALARLPVDVEAPALPAEGPQPGLIPAPPPAPGKAP